MNRVVVLGMLTKMPVPGVVWQTLQYLEGLRRLGCDVFYVEAHGRTPSMFMRHEHDDGSARAAAYLERTFAPFGFGDRWAFHAVHHDGRCFGRTERELEQLYRSAALILNLHGGTTPTPALAATDRLVYLETDPVQLQVELHDDRTSTVDFLEPHRAFFTFAENLGSADCGLPVDERFDFQPTRQPVVLDWWRDRATHGPSFTTIGNWRQEWREVRYGGETYHWSKHLEWARFLELPERTNQSFELALSGFAPDDQALLERHGWRVSRAMDLDADGYRDFICGSAGEMTVAKDQNIRLKTGWFSDRSATYLAAGRPVITQDTGFGAVLPTGEGLFAVSDLDAAVDAVQRIAAEPERHRRAALAIAQEHFAHDVVLRPLLAHAGLRLSVGRRGAPRAHTADPAGTLPDELPLAVASRRPTTLVPEAELCALSAPLPRPRAAAAEPDVSIVVVCHDGLPFTKLCLTAVLDDVDEPALEVVVVDNGSTDGTARYLDALAAHAPAVRIVRNASNRGFPSAVNQGVEAARGATIVLLNNDVVVPRRWLRPLTAALDDERVGLVGPTTNRIGTGAEIEAEYRTLGEMQAFAAARAAALGAACRELDMAAMFCVALRRSTFRQVGPLDESFGTGLLEDDDYSTRVRAVGLRVVCAEGAFVHHFGEASFGRLVATGERAALLRDNRRRFARKHGVEWQPYDRPARPGYDAVTERVRAAVERHVPPDATVMVVSRGDERLLDLGGRRAWHFPQVDGGVYAGHHPADSAEAIALLEALRARGGDYLLFPETGRWWLEHYRAFAEHLARSGPAVVDDAGACVIFQLSGVPA